MMYPHDDDAALQVAVQALTRGLLKVLERHEEERHDPGEHCTDERMNVIGYVAHCLGYRAEQWTQLLTDLQRYDERHRAHETEKGHA